MSIVGVTIGCDDGNTDKCMKICLGPDYKDGNKCVSMTIVPDNITIILDYSSLEKAIKILERGDNI